MNDSADLWLRTQQNLVSFLHVELDLAETFSQLAIDHAHYRTQLIEKIRKAIETVRHFEGRVEDFGVRRQIAERVERLEKFVESTPSPW